MVKTGKQVSEKFALKYDAYANMLRAKRLDKLSIMKFQKNLLLSVNLDNWLQGLDLPFGKLGAFSDLAKKYAYKGTDILADLERLEIDIGYFEALVNFLSTALTLYERCVYPQSAVRSQIIATPDDFNTLFPETVEKRILENLILDLNPVNTTSCFLVKSKVCCHKVVKALSPMLPLAYTSFMMYNIKPIFDSMAAFFEPYYLNPVIDRNVAVEIISNKEDFTTYTEVDPNSHISLTGKYHIGAVMYRNEDARLYKDKGVGHFSNFTHLVDAKITAASASGGIGPCWGLTNEIDDYQALYLNNKTCIFIFFFRFLNAYYLYLQENYSHNAYQDNMINITLNTPYYLKIEKSGTALTCKIYSDSARTNLLDTLNLTLHANHSLRYVFPVNTVNDSSNISATIEVDNLVL
jgi:hypothetical protein